MKMHPKYFQDTFNVSHEIIKKTSHFRFCWIIGSFLPRCDALKPLINDIISSTSNNDDKDNKLIKDIPLLLVYGKTDQYVSIERTLKVASCWDKDLVSIVEHEGGHYIPSHKDVKQKYVDFLSQQKKIIYDSQL